jgi:hypothetical protein
MITDWTQEMNQRFEAGSKTYKCSERTLEMLRTVRDEPKMFGLALALGVKKGVIVED